MSSTRNASRTTTTTATNSKPTPVNPPHTNGSAASYDMNESAANVSYPPGSSSEFDPNVQRSSLMRNVSQYDGIYRNARFIHVISSGLLGQQVVIQTSDQGRFHGVLETLSPNADIILTVSHRLDNNNNDILTSATLPIDTVDSSAQTFELQKRIIKAANIVEIIAADVDLSSNAKCSLDENLKVSHHEGDRFSRMEHFYGSDEIDPDTLEDLDLGDDGKAGFDPEDMFHTNRTKFNTRTDFDESKYTNIPVRQMSEVELAEIEKKVQEIERGTRAEDVDEDDAGVKRPSESHNLDDGNSNSKGNRSNRNDFAYDNEYNPSRRDNWREQRSAGPNSNRRGGGNNPRQNQYAATNNRQQYNTRIARNNRLPDTRSSYEGRELSTQHSNDDSSRQQRVNSGNFSQDQPSGPSSPSTTIPARTIYPSGHRPPANRNSPAPYTGSSSSRNNSISTISPPPGQQPGPNKLAKKPSLNEPQSATDESEQPKQQRSGTNPSNTAPPNRPPQLQSKQQSSSMNTNVTTSGALPNQDDNSSSHDTTNTSQSQATTPGGLNPEADEFVPVFPREGSSRPESRDASTASTVPMGAFLPHPHAQALQLLQQQHQQQQQQQQIPQQPTPPMIAATHAQNAAALYQQYYQTQFAGMPQFINTAPQQMTVGVMGTPMIPSQGLAGTSQNTNSSNNGSSSGMTTPNSSVSAGPTYKINNNSQTQSGDNSNNGGSNVPSKKAVVSVQRAEQSNMPPQQQQQQQQQPQQPPQMSGAPQMIFPTGPIRYYSPEYVGQQGAPQSMQLPQIPFYYQMNPASLIQATTAGGQHQNIMIPSAGSSAGPAPSGLPPLHYANLYADPRLYSLYSSAAVNQAGVNGGWQLTRSPPQQQQQQQQSQPAEQQQQQPQQQRGYGNGQNVPGQQGTAMGGSNMGGRSASTSGPSAQANTGPPITPQYALNGALPTTYAYGVPAGWIPSHQQVASSQANMPSQLNPGFHVIYDPAQSGPSQQPAYVHSNSYEAPAYYTQTSQQQQQQQPPSQQNLDQVPQGNYNR